METRGREPGKEIDQTSPCKQYTKHVIKIKCEKKNGLALVSDHKYLFPGQTLLAETIGSHSLS